MLLSAIDWQPFYLTAKLAAVTTLCLLLLGIPLARWIVYSRFRMVLETLVSMPLVLPPTVLGFYLLLLMSPHLAFGKWLLEIFDIQLLFTFEGLVVGSIFYSLPFMIQPIQLAFSSIPIDLREASKTLGKSAFQTFWHIELPMIRSALLVGSVMTFAHTVGEFGLVLMIGGSLPNVTNVASIAIYREVEMNNYNQAHVYALVMVIFCFGLLLALNWFNQRYRVSKQ